MDAQEHIDKALAGLKDFQRETVAYTIEQFYKNGKTKMLIADEVGLGKTIVSRGVIARMYEKFIAEHSIDKPFNVIYICSNQAIASQNIGKLNIFEGKDGESVVDYSRDDDRMTALAYKPKKIDGQFNFRIKALTPGTSFDQNTNAGRADERVLIFRLLYNHDLLKEKRNSLKWLIKGTRRMKEKNWDKRIKDAISYDKNGKVKYYLMNYRPIRRGVKTVFYKKLQERVPLNKLKGIYKELGIEKEKSCAYLLSKICSNYIYEKNYEKYSNYWSIVSYLRLLLSDCCKEYLKADIFVLDEFQRYNKLLQTGETDNPGVELARQILNKEGARVLMLSATPFKPYTSSYDELHGEHHYKEFKRVLQFLLKDEQPKFWKEFEVKRGSFFKYIRHSTKLKENFGDAVRVKQELEETYRSCISRTERMIVSKEKDAMIKSKVEVLNIQQEDIKDFVLFDKIVEHLNKEHACRLPIPMEYVKSCPYPLSFLTDYQHKKKLERHYADDPVLQNLIAKSRGAWVNLSLIKDYKPLFPKKSSILPNAKIRLLFDETINNNGWKYLWVPPSIPYYELQGAFKGGQNYSKTLIFSAWKMVPRMVASLVSYEAERLSVGAYGKKSPKHRSKYFNKVRAPRPLLKFAVDKETDTFRGMNNIMLNYPSIYLSSVYDSKDNLREEKSLKEIKLSIKATIRERLEELKIFTLGSGDGDWQKWYWYAVLLLDSNHEDKEHLIEWLAMRNMDYVAVDVEDSKNKADKTGKGKHLNEIKDIICNSKPANVSIITESQFENVLDYLVDLCLGAPAITAYRAMKKTFKEPKSLLLKNSYLIGSGFISLFNKPESIAVIQLTTHVSEDVYYRNVLRYAIDGNIQSMLDEYFYLLKDSKSAKDSTKLAQTISEILSIRPSPLEIGSISSLKNLKKKNEKEKEKNRIRTHFALAFGQKLSSAKNDRDINTREAFNSPFRPFVLASTSIGQEGLDFHFYCKKIVHWNLPTNPIDFEQREGRIHRYKGHVIRLNVASKFKAALVDNTSEEHLWDELFKIAIDSEKDSSDFPCDLIPCWHLETDDELSINRVVPLYPFSKDIDKYRNMLKVLAYYRFTFGQPRQDELIQMLQDNDDSSDMDLYSNLMINLSPIYFKKRHDKDN